MVGFAVVGATATPSQEERVHIVGEGRTGGRVQGVEQILDCRCGVGERAVSEGIE